MGTLSLGRRDRAYRRMFRASHRVDYLSTRWWVWVPLLAGVGGAYRWMNDAAPEGWGRRLTFAGFEERFTRLANEMGHDALEVVYARDFAFLAIFFVSLWVAARWARGRYSSSLLRRSGRLVSSAALLAGLADATENAFVLWSIPTASAAKVTVVAVAGGLKWGLLFVVVPYVLWPVVVAFVRAALFRVGECALWSRPPPLSRSIGLGVLEGRGRVTKAPIWNAGLMSS